MRVAEELHGNPDHQRPAYESDVVKLEQPRGEKGQDDTEGHRRRSSRGDTDAAFPGRQRLHRQRDDDRVIARKQNVDQNDREYVKEEWGELMSH